MVQAVVHPEFSEPLRGSHHMSGPVYEGIKEVSRKKTGKEPERELGISHNPENDIEDTKEDRGHYQSGNRGHQQAFFIPWIEVVGAMHDKVESLRPFCFGNPMKHIPVQHVFRECPEE